MGLFCLSNNSFIDFTTNPPTIGTHASNLCNGKSLPPKINICCPIGFYSNGLKGCELCPGNIFGVDNYQVCCQKNQIFD